MANHHRADENIKIPIICEKFSVAYHFYYCLSKKSFGYLCRFLNLTVGVTYSLVFPFSKKTCFVHDLPFVIPPNWR